MNINEIKTYSLRAEHHASNDTGWEETQRFERRVNIKLLKPFTATFYNKEMDMNFISENTSGFLYEIEITDTNALFSNRIKQAEDLYNRSDYLFDWLHLQFRNDGVVKILNQDELAYSWKELKEKLMEEYESSVTEKYLEKLSLFFQSEKAFREAFHQYFYFGLLFPGIPARYYNPWEDKRILRLSPYDKESFEEHIHFVNEENKLRNYVISGIAMPGNEMKLNTYTGNISYNPIEKLVVQAQVKIGMQQDDFFSEWNFDLAEKNHNR